LTDLQQKFAYNNPIIISRGLLSYPGCIEKVYKNLIILSDKTTGGVVNGYSRNWQYLLYNKRCFY
jgi:hypothetical protein